MKKKKRKIENRERGRIRDWRTIPSEDMLKVCRLAFGFVEGKNSLKEYKKVANKVYYQK
jgi:hypothetical protein